MEAWGTELLDVWQKNRVQIAETILEGVQNNPHLPVKAYTADDLLQMFDGTLAMLREDLVGEGTEIWDTFMSSVIPGILAQGQPLDALVGQVTMNGMLLVRILSPLISEAHQKQAVQFVSNWYYKCNAAIVKIGVDFEAQSKA